MEVGGDTRLDQLHDVIQRVMGWVDYHLHQFEISNQRFGNLKHLEYDEAFLDESRHTLQQVVPEIVPDVPMLHCNHCGENTIAYETQLDIEKH